MSGAKKIAAAATAAAALTLGGAWYGYQMAFAGDRRRQSPIRTVPPGRAFDPYREQMLTNIDYLLAQPYETVRVRSYDGLELAGKYYAGDSGAPLIIFFHGYRSTAERDGSGGFRLCREKGWHILLADQRAHGKSEGRTIAFGIRERYDCRTWAEAMAKRLGPETPIFLWGISMGAATVLMSADLPMPKSVRGIVADYGYDSPGGILHANIRRHRWPDFPLYSFAALGARLFGGFRLGECSALACVARARLPILLIHGEADRMVPCSMAYALRDACASPVTLLTVPGADHGISWYVDMEGYQKALLGFMETCME